MEIVRGSELQAQTGPPEWFTGAVTVEPLVRAPLALARVSFEARARTAWHTHPHGQALHIVSGVALVGRSDGTVERLAPGDAAWFAPGENHWHGAAADGPMVHLALQQPGSDGAAADWGAHVSDAEYGG